MKLRPFPQSAVGPLLTATAGATLIILARAGVIVPYNDHLLLLLIVFSGFYGGIASGYASIAVAGALYGLVLAWPRTFPDFTDQPWQDGVALGALLPLIILMIALLRRRLDERVLESEEGYRTVVESIDEVFFLLSTDFMALYYVSPAFEKIWGRPISKFYANPHLWLDTIHPDDRASVLAYIDALHTDSWQGGVPRSLRVLRPDGSMRWVAPQLKILQGREGKPDRFAGIIRDITEELAMGAAAEESQRRFMDVLNSTPVAIFTTDRNGILTMRKGRGGARARVKPDEGIGESYFANFKDVPEHVTNVRRALAGESFTARLRVRDGYYDISYAPILTPAQDIDGMIGIATDITERWEAERYVKEISDLKNTFVTVVSHQLRTPLSAVRWNLEIILNEEFGKLKKAQKESLLVTYTANGEVIRRVNDFLLALDIGEGRTVKAKRLGSLESIYHSVVQEMKRQCEARGLNCVSAPVKVGPTDIFMDDMKIRSVMEKLVDNAITYTKSGSITVHLRVVGGRLRFEITDTGISIPEADRAKIFQRFYRASNAMRVKTDASGLGLYIAKHYVESHRGMIGFESKEGGGSTFWFELPGA